MNFAVNHTKLFFFILCHLLFACRESKTSQSSASPSRNSSVRITQREIVHTSYQYTTVREEIDAANRDPLIQLRLAEFTQSVLNDPRNEHDQPYPGCTYERLTAINLVSLYAMRYPRAGLAWIYSYNESHHSSSAANMLVAFVMQLQESKPGVALSLLKQMDAGKRKTRFAELLAWHSRPGEFDSMWEYLLDPHNGICSTELKRCLIAAERNYNPDNAWERLHQQLPESANVKEFFSLCAGRMNADIAYPTRFFSETVDEGGDLDQHITSAIDNCYSRKNIASIETWLRENHEGYDVKKARLKMGNWWQTSMHDSAAANSWISQE